MTPSSAFLPSQPAAVPPVLLLAFNRPAHTREVLDAIRKARPTRLFIAADGPRPGNASDEALCRRVRALAETVDWPCRVQTLFREANLGARRAVSEAIDWFFSEVEEGMVLEDDIVPSPAFFGFCSELLRRYRNTPEVMMIAGTNPAAHRVPIAESYAFSGYALIWGWATWRRAWRRYDVDLASWPSAASRHALTGFHATSPRFASMWADIFDSVKAGRPDTWCYQWVHTLFIHGGISVIPAVNLVRNIGFGLDATHTSGPPPAWMLQPDPKGIENPLIHPGTILLRAEVDRAISAEVYGLSTWAEIKFAIKRLLAHLRRWMPG